MTAEIRISKALRGIARQLEDELERIGGERVGFCLVVMPIERTQPSGVSYVSNVERSDLLAVIDGLSVSMRARKADIPLHKQH